MNIDEIDRRFDNGPPDGEPEPACPVCDRHECVCPPDNTEPSEQANTPTATPYDSRYPEETI